MLQCVFTGKAQRAFSAASPAESDDYVKVNMHMQLCIQAYLEEKGQINPCRICTRYFCLISLVGALPLM